MPDVPQPCLWLSHCRIHSCKSLGMRAGGSLAFPQHTPYLLAGGRGTSCISTGRAGCKRCLQPTRPAEARRREGTHVLPSLARAGSLSPPFG